MKVVIMGFIESKKVSYSLISKCTFRIPDAYNCT